MFGLTINTFGIILIRAGAVFLLCIGLVYIALGYPYLSKGLLNIEPALSGEVRAIWLAFSVHLILIAALVLMYSRRSSLQMTLLWLCGSVLFVDGLLVRHFVSSLYLPAQGLQIAGLIILVGTFSLFWKGFVQRKARV